MWYIYAINTSQQQKRANYLKCATTWMNTKHYKRRATQESAYCMIPLMLTLQQVTLCKKEKIVVASKDMEVEIDKECEGIWGLMLMFCILIEI